MKRKEKKRKENRIQEGVKSEKLNSRKRVKSTIKSLLEF